MRASNIITLQVFNGSIWVDYTDGLITSDIVRGIQEYIGPLSQPDVGQLTINSRNPLLDPFNNPSIKYNAKIRLNAYGIRIFTGTIEGIHVDYQPQGKPAVVTINAIDMLGSMQKHILSDAFLTANTSTYDVFTNLSSQINGYQIITFDTDNLTYVEGPSPSGSTALEAASIRAKTDRGFFYANARNEISYFRREPNNQYHPYNSRATKITFDYDGNGESYQRILLSDGFDNIVNAIDIDGTSGTKITSLASDSINVWGKSSANLQLQTSNISSLQAVANQVLVEMSEPIREIYSITWDAINNPDTAHSIDLFDNIQINHKINETTTINRKYSVVGIKHQIDANDWLVTYELKNFDYQTTSVANPVVVINPTSGDTNTNFTVTWTHANPELFTTTYWDLDDGFTSTNRTATVNYNIEGTKYISLVATTIYGYTKEVTVPLEVVVGAPQSSFTYTVDANRVYHFTFTGDSATSYLWTFGDGETSTEANPTHYYFTGGSKTVKVEATNRIGTTSATQYITALPLLKIPVRYLRLKYVNVTNTYTDYENSIAVVDTYDGFRSLKVKKTDNSVVTGWNIINHDEYYGYMTEFPQKLDDYRRHQSVPHNTMTTRLSGLEFVYPMQYGNQTLSSTTAVMSQIIDLGQEYFDLSKIEIERRSGNYGFGTNIILEVSRDQGIWYRHGIIQSYTGNNLTSNFTLENTQITTPTYSLPVADAIPDYLPIRYVRIVTNTFANTSAKQFQFNEIIALAPASRVAAYGGTYSKVVNGITYTGERPCDNAIGFGSIDESRHTGAVISYPTSLNVGTIGTSTNTGSYNINPGTIVSGYVNQKNTKTILSWDESVGNRTLLIDFGVPIKKLYGIHFDVRHVNGSITTSPDSNFKVTIWASPDGVNWTTYNQTALSLSMQTGGVSIINSSVAPLTSGSVLSTVQLDSTSLIPLTP